MRMVFSDDHIKRILGNYIYGLKLFGKDEIMVEEVNQKYDKDVEVTFTVGPRGGEVIFNMAKADISIPEEVKKEG